MPAKKKSSATLLSARIAADWKVALPERLVRFFDHEKKDYEGRSVFGMGGFDGASKMALRFAAGELGMFADYAKSMTGKKPAEFLPIAAAGRDSTYYVAVDLTQPELPVHFFDYESGFAPYAPDFDTFLKTKLLKKGEKTPGERMSELYQKAKKLVEAKKYAQAEKLLLPALPAIPAVAPRTFDMLQDLPGNLMNLLGLCRENRGDVGAATADFERATTLGNNVAGLNLCRLYLKRGDLAGLITYGEVMRARIHFMLSEYEWFWIRHYLGQAYLGTGDVPKAVVAYHQIRKVFTESDPAKIKDAAEELREIAAGKKPGAAAAAEILRWFDPPAVVLSDERKQKVRAFWDKVPKEAREKLLAAAGGGKPGAKRPADDVLDRVLRLTRIRLEHLKITDWEFLKDFDRPVDLGLEGSTLPDLAPVIVHLGLERLNLRNTGITTLKPLAVLTRLQDLSCSENKLISLDGLQSLRRLAKLHAPKTEIRDLSPLAGLPELEEATVYSNPIDDLTPLASCPRLKEISSFGVQKPLRGLTALQALPRLEKVNGGDAPEGDVAALRKARPDVDVDTGFSSVPARRVVYTAEELEPLRAFWNDRAKLGPDWKKLLEKTYEDNADDKDKGGEPTPRDLANLFREDSIRLDKRGLTTIAPIVHFRSMDYLSVSKNRVTDLQPLSGHAWLETLWIDDNLIASLAPLATLKRLEKLRADRNPLESLAGLEGVRTLRELHVDQNRIRDLAPIRGLTDLRTLAFVGNRVESLEPLSSLGNLEDLYAYDNAFKDLSPLAGCRRLQTVECFANPGLKGVLALKDLPELRKVVSHGVLPADEIREFARLRPDVEID